MAAYRVQLTDKAFPFLATETGELLRWSGGDLLEALHTGAWIELAPRGMRVGAPHHHATRLLPPPSSSSSSSSFENATMSGWCWASPDALCEDASGARLLPSVPVGQAASAFLGAFPVSSSSAASAAADAVASRRYARQDACAFEGQGRSFVLPSELYTVTACDVVQGRLVLLLDPLHDRVLVVTQSLGPMAYSVALLQAVVCLYFAGGTAASSSSSGSNNSSPSSSSSAAALWLLLSCFIVVLQEEGVPVVTLADALHFWLWGLTGVALAAGQLLLPPPQPQQQGAEACVYALGALTNIVYRSPENPYAGIVCAILVVRQWQKLLRAMSSSSSSWSQAANLVLTSLALCATAELGVAPQCRYRERWPFYAGLGLYLGFGLAVQRERPKPSAALSACASDGSTTSTP